MDMFEYYWPEDLPSSFYYSHSSRYLGYVPLSAVKYSHEAHGALMEALGQFINSSPLCVCGEKRAGITVNGRHHTTGSCWV